MTTLIARQLLMDSSAIVPPLGSSRHPAFHAPEEDDAFTEHDFIRIAAFAHREFGLYLPPGKISHVRSRLTRLLDQTGHKDFNQFCARLEQDPNGLERQALVSALTTNVTQFFREDHHFRLLADSLLRPRLAELRKGQRLRIWSAGCSAGQEALSAALVIKSLLPDAEKLNIRILGTDIDPTIISDARRGEYPIEELQGVPAPMRAGAVEVLPGGARFRIAPNIASIIHFAELNLIGDWPLKGPFDVIFCRNVAIYFDKPTQSRLWSRFADLLAPGGLLLIGHSERVSGPAVTRLTSAGITTYRLSGAASPVERSQR